MPFRAPRAVLAFLLCVGASSCVGWRTDDFDRAPLAPLVETRELTYDLVLTDASGRTVTQRDGDGGPWSIDEWAGIERVLSEFGAGVERAAVTLDRVHIEVRIVYGDEQWRWLSFLSGITLTVIPSWGRTRTVLLARITVPGERPVEYHAEGGVFGWFWLPLVVAVPFANPAVVEMHVPFDLLRDVLRQAVEDGVLR